MFLDYTCLFCFALTPRSTKNIILQVIFSTYGILRPDSHILALPFTSCVNQHKSLTSLCNKLGIAKL
jgi:hypothetical protein